MLSLLLLLTGTLGQTSQQQQSLAAMKEALDQQRASVALQRATTARQNAVPRTTSLSLADCPPLSAIETDAVVQTASQKASLQPELLRAVMRQESGFRPCAVSPKGAQGLMQLMPQTAASMGVRDALHPEQNAVAGAKYLRSLLDLFQGDLRLALAAYNAGPAAVTKTGGVPPIPETTAYVESIMRSLAGLPVTR